MKFFCETNKLYLFDITPITFLLDLQDENCEIQLGSFANFFYKNQPPTYPKIENLRKQVNDFK